MWGLNSLLLGENLAIVIILPFVGHLPRGMNLDYIVSLLLLRVSFFISLVLENLSSLQVICINSCSVNSCNFGVPMGGGELRVFLCYHLGHTCIVFNARN